MRIALHAQWAWQYLSWLEELEKHPNQVSEDNFCIHDKLDF